MFIFRSFFASAFLFLMGQSSALDATENHCIDRLTMLNHQKWILHFFQKYKSKASIRLGSEYIFTAIPRVGGSVISFGSGPDVIRPIADFPLAERFHLVDVLTGWGESPSEVLFEIKKRLLSLHPTAEVQMLNSGFMNW